MSDTSDPPASMPSTASPPPAARISRPARSAGLGGAVPLFGLLAVLLALVGGILYILIRGAAPTPTGPRAAGAAPAEIAARERALATAGSAFVQGEYAKAAGALGPAIDAAPEDQELRLLMVQALCGLKDFAAAYRHMEAALAIGPTPAELHFDAGTIANAAGLHGRALEHYSMAQQANPREPRYPLYLAMMQIKAEQASAAMASLVRAVNLDPDLAEAWGTLAELEVKENALGLALDHVRKARALQPRVARWRLVEARVLRRQGDAEGALALLTALDDADRFTRDALGSIGECCGLLGRPAVAAEQYARAALARAGTADEGEFHARAAEWYGRAGDESAGQKHARRARDLGHP